ncbi:FAD/NAD(P)-binding protein [Geopseudomonas aromaticivorans]
MKTLAIIGAGFSGAVTAIQFLREAQPGVRVVLINRSGAMARGLAYGTNSPEHLLNVPAGNMSALADESESFVEFCRGRLASVTAGSFVPRKLYGDYLAWLLDDAERHCREGLELQRMTAEVCRLSPQGSGVIIGLAEGGELLADRVVLAFGHFAPVAPVGVDPARTAGRYQGDPWSGSRLVPAEMDQPILLVGAGLTALDVALGLLQQGHRGGIYMLSRRGLLPQAHRGQRSAQEVPVGFGERLLALRPTARSYLYEIRRQVELHAHDGLDWRDLLAALRSFTPELWRRLPDVERRRFLRHLQPYWDVHRHRVAPVSYRCFEQALAHGRIKPVAGRIKAIEPCAEGLRVSIQRRCGERVEQIKVARVVNCTGPNADLRRVEDGLIAQLREEGLIQLDPYGLGLCVDDRLAVTNAAGVPSSWLSYVGPMLKADLWEATAVPELRQHAKSLAARLAEDFRSQSEAAEAV